MQDERALHAVEVWRVTLLTLLPVACRCVVPACAGLCRIIMTSDWVGMSVFDGLSVFRCVSP